MSEKCCDVSALILDLDGASLVSVYIFYFTGVIDLFSVTCV